MTPEIDKREVNFALAVAVAAAKSHRGCAPETCGGSRLDPCSLGNALDALQAYQAEKGYLASRARTDETVIGKAHEFYGDEMYPPTECSNCAPLTAGASVTRVDGSGDLDQCRDCGAQPPAEWLPATMMDCLPGDRIRLGTEETTVLTTSLERWHAKNREYPRHDGKTGDHQTRWDHLELRMRLEAIPELTQYPTDVEIEILCTPERKAALLLQQTFPKPVDI